MCVCVCVCMCVWVWVWVCLHNCRFTCVTVYICCFLDSVNIILLLLCRHHSLGRVSGVFTLNWPPTNMAGKFWRGLCFCVIHMSLVTGLSIIDCVRYKDIAISEQHAQYIAMTKRKVRIVIANDSTQEHRNPPLTETSLLSQT